MISVVGVFPSREPAERGAARLRQLGLRDENLTVLFPGASEAQIHSVRTMEAEPPGIGKAMGGVLGGALGASAVPAAAAFFVPAVGPVISLGLLGMALFGTAGAIAGAKAGEALDEKLTEGLPIDALYVYEDALRKGRSVVIGLADDEEQAETARKILQEEGAESLDAATHAWWLGLRDAEEAEYVADGGDWRQEEHIYRQGFEAALHPSRRGKPYDVAVGELRQRHPDVYETNPFKRGYARGVRYHEQLVARQKNSVQTE